MEYYNKLKAPVKRLYLFENSAHSPLFEEPGKFREVVKETLAAGSRHPAEGCGAQSEGRREMWLTHYCVTLTARPKWKY